MFVYLYYTFGPFRLACVALFVTGVWLAQPTTGDRPPAMADHTFTKIDNTRAVVFGGSTWWKPLNDVYILDMDAWVCVVCVCSCIRITFVHTKLI